MKGSPRARRLRKALLVALLCALVVWLASEVMVPRWVEHRLASGLLRTLGDARAAHVEVRASPALKALAGRFDSVDIDVRDAIIGGLPVVAAALSGRNLVLDVSRLAAGDGMALDRAEALDVSFHVSEEGLNAYLRDQLGLPASVRVGLVPGSAELTGTLRVLGRELAVRVAGRFLVERPHRVIFVPLDAAVENAVVPEFLLDLVRDAWEVSIDLDQEVIPMVVDEIVIDTGRLVVRGRHPIVKRW